MSLRSHPSVAALKVVASIVDQAVKRYLIIFGLIHQACCLHACNNPLTELLSYTRLIYTSPFSCSDPNILYTNVVVRELGLAAALQNRWQSVVPQFAYSRYCWCWCYLQELLVSGVIIANN